MKTKDVNGITFKVLKPQAHIASFTEDEKFHPYAANTNDKIAIYKAYCRPSIKKVSAWSFWVDWINEINLCDDVSGVIWISSANCMKFSIKGALYLYGDYYNLWITADNNYIIPIEY